MENLYGKFMGKYVLDKLDVDLEAQEFFIYVIWGLFVYLNFY